MSLLHILFTVFVGVIFFAGGFIVSELSRFYSVIYLELTEEGRSSGLIPMHALPNRDIRGIAAAICHGEQFLDEYQENVTAAGGADYARFVCAN